MAAGNYLIRRNASNTDTLPNAGSDLLLLWDTAVANDGSGITYSAGTFTLGETGHFLVLCSDQYGTPDADNNRCNAKTTFTLDGTELVEGYSTGYIRKTSGSQEFINFSAAIINVATTTGTGDELEVRHERIDSISTTTVDRIPDRSGITIIKLDDTWGYGRYESTTVFTTSGTDNAAVTATLGTTNEEDSPFEITTNTIDIATDNFVLAVYSIKSEETSPVGRAEYQGRLTLGGTVVPGSYTQTYIRANENSDWGGYSNICLLNPTSGQDLEVEIVSREEGGEDFVATVQLVELPAAAAVCIVEATTGDFNTADTNFSWDTNPVIDTDVFTHTTTQANVDVDVDGDYLVGTSLAVDTAAGTAGTRAVPAVSFRVNTTDDETAGGSSYNRDSGTADHATVTTGTLLTGLSTSDSIYALCDRLGTVTTTSNNTNGAMFVLQLDSLFDTGAYEMPATNQEYDLAAIDVTLTVTYPDAFIISASDDITASGEDTTVQLTAPASGTFVAGRIQDDENPADTVDITTDNYTELEWCIKATSESSEVSYDFRVTVEGVVIDTYTVTPQLTIAAAGDEELDVTSQTYVLAGLDVTFNRDYAVDATSQTYVLAGQDVTFNRDYAVDATSQTYDLAGQDITFNRDYVVDATSQTYNLAGQDVTFEVDYVVDADTQTYLLGSIAVGLETGYRLAGATEAYNLAGQDPGLELSKGFDTDSQTYVLGSTAVDLAYSYKLEATSQTYNLSGQDVTFDRDYTLDAISQTYDLVGQDVIFEVDYVVEATSQTYDLAGQDVTFEIGYAVDATSQTYDLAGQDVTFEVNYVVDATSQTYNLAGQDVAFNRDYVVDATSQTYVLDGQDVTFEVDYVLDAISQTYNLAGQDVTFKAAYVVDTTNQTYVLDGSNVTFEVDYVVDATNQTYDLVGQDISLETDDSYELSAETQSYALDGGDVTFDRDYVVDAITQTYVLAGQDVTLKVGYTVVIETQSYILTGADSSTIIINYIMSVDSQTYDLDGQDVTFEAKYAIDAASQTYVLDGQDVTFEVDYAVDATSQTYDLVGQDVTFEVDYVVDAISRAYNDLLNDPEMEITDTNSTGTGDWAWSGWAWEISTGALRANVAWNNTTLQKPTAIIPTSGKLYQYDYEIQDEAVLILNLGGNIQDIPAKAIGIHSYIVRATGFGGWGYFISF